MVARAPAAHRPPGHAGAPAPRSTAPARASLLLLLADVRHAVDRAGEVVGNEERAILHHRDVHRAAAIRAGLVVEPAFGEDARGLRRSIGLEVGEHHARADRLGAVPGAVLRREDAALVPRG